MTAVCSNRADLTRTVQLSCSRRKSTAHSTWKVTKTKPMRLRNLRAIMNMIHSSLTRMVKPVGARRLGGVRKESERGRNGKLRKPSRQLKRRTSGRTRVKIIHLPSAKAFLRRLKNLQLLLRISAFTRTVMAIGQHGFLNVLPMSKSAYTRSWKRFYQNMATIILTRGKNYAFWTHGAGIPKHVLAV